MIAGWLNLIPKEIFIVVSLEKGCGPIINGNTLLTNPSGINRNKFSTIYNRQYTWQDIQDWKWSGQ